MKTSISVQLTKTSVPNSYDKAQLLVPSKVGIQLMQYLRSEVSTTDYRVTINTTWLAQDLGATREAVSRNLSKLIKAHYIIKEKRNKYFVSPDMFWVIGMNDNRWQELKQNFTDLIK